MPAAEDDTKSLNNALLEAIEWMFDLPRNVNITLRNLQSARSGFKL